MPSEYLCEQRRAGKDRDTISEIASYFGQLRHPKRCCTIVHTMSSLPF